jgi:hypothetical protein
LAIALEDCALLSVPCHRCARADEKLTAFVELERAIHEFAVDAIS